MSEPADAVEATAPSGPAESGDEELSRSLGVRSEAARLLREAGFTSLAAVRGLSDAKLRELGIEAADIEALRRKSPPAKTAAETAETSSDRVMERWQDKARKADRPKRRGSSTIAGQQQSASVLKKWVDGDDSAMESWIQSAETERPAPAPAPVVAPAPEVSVGTAPTASSPGPAGNLIAREETIVRWLTDLLERVKSDQFDPAEMLQEVQELHRTVFEEQAKRAQLEEELEHVKRGSIAVIKYVRSREAKTRDQAIQEKDSEIAELRLRLYTQGVGIAASESGAAAPPVAPEDRPEGPVAGIGLPGAVTDPNLERRLREEFQAKESQLMERESELRHRIVQLEGEVRNLRSETGAVQQREELRRQSGSQLSENLAKMMADAETRERELSLRENELRTRFDEIRIATEDLERKRAPLAFKERELDSWEQTIQKNRQALEVEVRKFEQRRSEDGPISEGAEGELVKLEAIKVEIQNKEAELKAHEAYLRSKIEELEGLQRRGIEVDTERVTAATNTGTGKIHSGVRRLDDLLFGGFPPGSQMIVNGPAHTGKEILARLFIMEGLKQAVPALVIATDKTYTQVREEMTVLLPGYPEFEQKGMVKYFDLYSRSLGITQSDPGVRLLSASDKGVLDQLGTAVNNATFEFKEKFGGYRVVFESASTLSAYLDTAALFRFLQPFAGRRKLDGAVSYYLLETGMHTESDLQTIEHMMDGSINLKVDQLKTFLSVKGIAEVQSRAWIGYTFSKKAFSLGSFSLDHIR
jgi:KaiC/GvpD/RAD55 family RecA-like ATPase